MTTNKRPSGRQLSRRAALSRTCLLVVACLPLSVHGADQPGSAGEGIVSAKQIEQALTRPAPAGLTRGLTIHPKGSVPSATAKNSELPAAIDLNIGFEFNSSQLQPQALAQLMQLDSALTSQALREQRFMIAGHTDAKGGAQYNQQLSLRRADAVKQFLIANGIEGSRLQTAGYGAEQLLTPDRPEDPSNRRVEIRNLGVSP